MTTTEIFQQLQHVPGKAEFAPYENALRAAIEQREVITPELIAVIDRVAADPAHYLKNYQECLHLFAIYLLAQFRERRALDSLVRFFSLPGDQSLDLTGDMVTGQGAAILASVCGGDPAPLLRLVHDESVNEFVREQAIVALVVQTLWGERPREAVVEDLRRLFHTLPKPGDAYVWAALVGAIYDFPAPELAPEVRQAFAEKLVDEEVVGGVKDVETELSLTVQRRLDDPRERHAPIDAVAEVSCWLCFRDDEDDEPPADEDFDEEPERDEPLGAAPEPQSYALPDKPIPYVAPRKVGRNEPCPCGSGKKYKKCCGK